MIEATPKAYGIDAVLGALTGKDRVETVAESRCVTCKAPDMRFRDDLSRKEYTISGMCQKCQDVVFAPPPDE